MDIPAWAALLEHSLVGTWMRSSGWAYPVVNLVHLLGLTLLIGPMLLLDLRLLGLGRQFVLAAVSHVLTRWAIAGLLLLLASGALLFSADAGPLLDNRLLQVKVLLIALGLANALVFRLAWRRGLAGWDGQAPWPARLQAGGSLLIWLAAATLGRLIAYA